VALLCRYCFFFAAYNAAVTDNAFQWAGQPENCTFPFRDLDPHLTMVPWAHARQLPKPHLDRFSRFCEAHERVQLQTDNATPSIAIGRI